MESMMHAAPLGRRLAAALALLSSLPMLSLLCATALGAEAWPQRAVRLLVPVAPGGASDFTARLVGQKLSEAFGQNVVIDNRAGAAGIIATEIVARAVPDGHTFLVSSNTTHGIGPVLYRKLPYDAMKDFTHVGLVATIPTAMVVHPSVPAATVRDFVALAKAKPEAYSFASSGGGSSSRLLGELFKTVTGAPLTHVPYKGSGLATVDLTAGSVHVMFDGLPSHMSNVRAGKLRVLAVLWPKRSGALPEVPTMAEAGYPAVEGALWYGLSGPAALPPAVVDRLSRELRRIATLDDVAARLASVGAFPSPMGPAEYTQFIRVENARWGPVVRASGATAD